MAARAIENQLLDRNRSHPPRWFVGLGGVALAVAG